MESDLLVRGGVIVAFLALVWVLSDWGRYGARLRRAGEGLHLVAPQPPSPVGPPIERIAADARRIRAEIKQAPPGAPVARMRGWLAAYDDVLVSACERLGIEQRLVQLAPGPVRDLERERVERMLVRAGFPLASAG
ncbi:hypothetical protein [Nocardioides campestrisoli]|uniref:hypothetical protein n=1 Tax=Nocardioides campestrisoli TaxID=2736757 RepID=UPI0015E6D480|nr:hypothetical protein [Nocardioides campestrisoli]